MSKTVDTTSINVVGTTTILFQGDFNRDLLILNPHVSCNDIETMLSSQPMREDLTYVTYSPIGWDDSIVSIHILCRHVHGLFTGFSLLASMPGVFNDTRTRKGMPQGSEIRARIQCVYCMQSCVLTSVMESQWHRSFMKYCVKKVDIDPSFIK